MMVERLQGQRSINGALYLLSGKRSAQTIQDASLFNVLPLTASLKHRPFDQLVKVKNILEKNNWIGEDATGKMTLTSYGRQQLFSYQSRLSLPEYFNGGRFEWNGETDWFWQRLSLFIQSLSNVLCAQSSFIPVQYDYNVQFWVKNHFPRNRSRQAIFSNGLYNELHTLLAELPNEDAMLFVSRLSSSTRIGKTTSQLTENGSDEWHTFLRFRSVLHYIIGSISKTERVKEFPSLTLFLMQETEDGLLTKSAIKTLELLRQGCTIDEIPTLRGLKRSTIEDHIMEITLLAADFPADYFLSREKIALIQKTAKRLNTKRLKAIKTALGEEVDYFMIRLALADLKERVS